MMGGLVTQDVPTLHKDVTEALCNIPSKRLGFKTSHAKWLYDTGSEKLSCFGAIGCYERDALGCEPPIPPEVFWQKTDGTYIAFRTHSRRVLIFFWMPVIIEVTMNYYWFWSERKMAIKAFEKLLGYTPNIRA